VAHADFVGNGVGILFAIGVGAWGVSVSAVKPIEPDEAVSASHPWQQ
jgi:hypothetical protein